MHCLGSASRERRLCQPRATALPRLSTMGATLSGRCPDAVRTLSALRGVYRTGVCAHGHARAEVWNAVERGLCVEEASPAFSRSSVLYIHERRARVLLLLDK
jgi:hypothetical protein